MPPLSRKLTFLVCAALALLAGCAGSVAPTALPTASPVPASPSPGPSSQPIPTATLSRATTAPTDAPPGGDLLYTWYLNQDQKAAYLVSRDGTGQQRILADVVGDIRATTWSPDGHRIAFVVRDTEYPGGAIWTAAADGAGASLYYDGLDAGCVDVFHPVWSPGGSAMSMVCYGAREASLAVLDLESMELTRLVTYPWPDFLDGPARWSNDGRTLAYTVLHWDPTDTFLTGSRLATVLADGTAEPAYLSDYDSFYSGPDWSPDDQKLVFNSYDLGNMRGEISNLYLSDADGSSIEELTMAADAGVERVAQGVWDPDGTRIWVGVVDNDESSFHIGWVDPDTGQLTTLPTVSAGAEPRP